jgi:hypothetical protein
MPAGVGERCATNQTANCGRSRKSASTYQLSTKSRRVAKGKVLEVHADVHRKFRAVWPRMPGVKPRCVAG